MIGIVLWALMTSLATVGAIHVLPTPTVWHALGYFLLALVASIEPSVLLMNQLDRALSNPDGGPDHA